MIGESCGSGDEVNVNLVIFENDYSDIHVRLHPSDEDATAII